MDLTSEIVVSLIDDLKGRQGFDNIWDSMDDDVREEMISEWKRLTKNHIELYIEAMAEDDEEDELISGKPVNLNKIVDENES